MQALWKVFRGFVIYLRRKSLGRFSTMRVLAVQGHMLNLYQTALLHAALVGISCLQLASECRYLVGER